MSFLPENYEAPRSSNFYFKIQEGENRIRILTSPVMGWEDWKEKKPIRFALEDKPATSIDPKKPVRYFWAFVVYNYVEQRIQIMHITQATIRKSIEALCKDADWGDPFSYDIKITKTGEGKNTEYSVNPVPHKLADPIIFELFNENRCNLNALFTGDDPFSQEWDTFTPLGISGHRNNIEKKNTISQEQAMELSNIFSECDSAYIKKLWSTLNKPPISIQKISDLPLSLFEKIKKAALENPKLPAVEPVKNLEDIFEENYIMEA